MAPTRSERDVRLLIDLPRIAEPILHETYRRDCCVAATRISIEVLRAFGITAKPLEVEMLVGNRLAAAAWDEGTEPDWAAGAWSVGVQRTPEGEHVRPGAWRGAHLVAVAETDEMVGVVDLSLRQAARPQLGIPLAAATFPLPTSWDRVEPVKFEGPAGTVVVLRPLVPIDESYRKAPDWQRAERWKPVVGRIVRAVRAAGLTAESSGD